MVTMEVANKYMVDFAGPEFETAHLYLCAFAAVD